MNQVTTNRPVFLFSYIKFQSLWIKFQQIVRVCKHSYSTANHRGLWIQLQQIVRVCKHSYSTANHRGLWIQLQQIFRVWDSKTPCFCDFGFIKLSQRFRIRQVVCEESPKFWGRLSTFLHFHSGWREQRFSAWNFSTNVGNFVLLQKLVKSFSIYFPKTGGGGGGLDRNKRKRIAIIQTRQLLTNRRRRRRIR